MNNVWVKLVDINDNNKFNRNMQSDKIGSIETKVGNNEESNIITATGQCMGSYHGRISLHMGPGLLYIKGPFHIRQVHPNFIA